jgi:cytochrome d ubiquinol oxidase subunit II
MTLADLALALLVAGLTAYVVLGGADLGAGLWDLTSGGGERGVRVRSMVQRSMGPVWEANHVWLIFVLVVSWTAFPRAFGSAFSTLYLPLVLTAGGLILRGTAFALRGYLVEITKARVLNTTFAVSSLVVPFCLGAAVGGIGSGRVPVGNAAGDPVSSWLNPTSIAVGVLAVAAGGHLSATYLAADARRRRLADLERRFRARALGAGVAAGIIALAGLAVLHADARALFDGLTSGRGLACVAGSVVAGTVTLALVWTRRFEAARVCAAVTVAGVTTGWALAQYPYLLPGDLTIADAAAPQATLIALLVAVAIGALVLVPSLIALFRLFLRGELDEPLEPLERHLEPAAAGGQRSRA